MFSVAMGSGASKGEIPDEFNDDAFDDDDVSSGGDREGQDFHQKLENKRRLDALKAQQQKQKASFFGRKKAASEQQRKPPKIVGLEDSDDEDVKAAKAKARDDETEIKNGLNELEQTFNSLGLVGKKMWKDQSYDDETTRSFANSGRWDKNGENICDGGMVARQDSAGSNEFLSQSYSQHSRFPPRNSISRQHIHGFNGGHAVGHKKTALKFSWDEHNMELPSSRESEEWTYKKTVIEGFDPDRFRKANKAHGSVTSDEHASFQHRGHKYSARGGHAELERTRQVDIPGIIPTYDRSEQQIIAALEQELGL